MALTGLFTFEPLLGADLLGLTLKTLKRSRPVLVLQTPQSLLR